MTDPIVIVGAGQAGGWVAKTVRDKGYDGPVTLIGDEPHRPYERPPLSKAVLAGEAEDDSVHLFGHDLYDDLDIDFRPNQKVRAIDRAHRTLTMSDGDLAYDRLVLATGGRARTLPMPTHLADRIHTLRNLDDASRLRRTLRQGGRLTIVGGGWIGLEVAATARKMGCVVTVIEAAPRLCARAASEQLSSYLLDLHLANGVAVHLNTSVTSVEERNGTLVCALSDGATITTDSILVGIGLIPNVELAEAAGLPTDNGILVDADGRTADPSIFAVGDVAHRYSDLAGRRRRLESWANAQNEGIAVGHTIIGLDRPAEEVPWFWSDQHGVNIQILGMPADDDETVSRSNDTSQTVFYLAGDRLSGLHVCNDPMAIKVAKRLIARDMPVDAEKLADPSIPLKSLLKG